MFSNQLSPIAIDFGTSSVKLLQLSNGEKPSVVGAAELSLAESIRSQSDKRYDFISEHLPRVLKEGRFKGRRVIFSPPVEKTLVQHMQITPMDGVSQTDVLKSQLQMQIGVSPSGVVVRSTDVADIHKGGSGRKEVICVAISRDEVMKHVELLKKLRLEVVGVHAETHTLLWAFEHLHRRNEDASVTTMYVDIGWGGVKIAIGHGQKLAFAKCIGIGGKDFDHLIADALHCDLESARSHRLSGGGEEQEDQAEWRAKQTSVEGPAMLRVGMAKGEARQAVGKASSPSGSPNRGKAVVEDRRTDEPPAELRQRVEPGGNRRSAAGADYSELLDAIAEEVAMCLRYHKALFPTRTVDRTIFLGGEARQVGICRHIARVLHVPAQLGDPMARLEKKGTIKVSDLMNGRPQPGWAVACGLCAAPTDL